MQGYTYKEIGMLVGTAVGAVIAVTGFSLSNNILYLLSIGITIAAGVVVGNAIDKKQL